MSEMPVPVSAFRLRFIDMARGVAILLMLEGHFVDVTLAAEWRVVGHPVYDSWLYVRGMAAPMFFTVTGLIFAFLLSGVGNSGFWSEVRVRRGLRRAVELMVWGYILQVNLRLLPGLLRGVWDPWLQAFHVLQCIAVGVLAMIVIFWLVRRTGTQGLVAVFVGAGMLDFLFSVVLANMAGPFPQGAPAWLQNPLKGPWSNFPVAPWLGFTFYGAAIGVLVRHRRGGQGGGVSVLGFLGVGLLLKTLGWSLDRALGRGLLELLGNCSEPKVVPDVFHGRIGEILIVLGVLVWIENRFRPGAGWFQTIGRNTFPIYVAHVVVLYGGIFGIGLQEWFGRALNPWQAGLGAVLFCGFFGYCAQWVEPIMLRWRNRKNSRAADGPKIRR